MAQLIAQGYQCLVLFNGTPVGLATNASYDEDWQPTPANVLNYLGPIDWESQGYTCSIVLGTFIPEVPGSGPWPDGGVKAISDFLPTRSQVQQANGVVNKFALLQFANTTTGAIINQFVNVLLASNGTQITPNSYITANVRFMAVAREI